MLDENLPTFLLKTSTEKPTHNSTFYYTHHGSDVEPTYSLRHPDPELPGSKNRYAAALYDSHNPDVLFAEVLLIPDWTQPSLSAEAIRLNGGVAPPPEPILPGEFVVQLYNPDQQVKVRQKPGSWSSAPSWEFEMPQQSFRQPSTSSIDRTQNDPAASELTPRIGFRWKKDSKFTKDLACFLSGKTTNADGSKRRNKEPDITVAIFHALKEVTLYEPNLQRVEIEDSKGFEVVLLLSAVVIRDVYFGQMEQAFNISHTPGARPPSTSPRPAAAVLGLYGRRSTSPVSPRKKASSPAKPLITVPVSQRDNRIPPTDPRSQWEIDAETARLKKEAEAEERERKRKEAVEQKRVKKMLEAEEKNKRRKQAEVDKETERLKKIYGTQSQTKAAIPMRPATKNNHYNNNSQQRPSAFSRPQSVPQSGQPQARWGPPAQGPYLHVPGGYPSQSGFFGNAGPGVWPKLREKKSFFGFGRERDTPKLHKKKSSAF
ncbi:hypothetical protein GJ744_005104 [Endocarpon pusillum]|uniref:Uncharacterized protein n=1 Tax=Endocarpon pusillum TaxID=364733 RepID=A0A8H7AQN9_9EURO|nr:hypothetical protein GJ744_005104 [Endocarpon pusillum]